MSTPASGTTVNAKYSLRHYNRWGTGQGNIYKYASYGIWRIAKDAFVVSPHEANNANKPLTEFHAFVFADTSNRAMNMPHIGSAIYIGGHMTQMSMFSGNKDANGGAAVIPDQFFAGAGQTTNGTRYDELTFGRVRATVDFATRKVDFQVNDSSGYMYYDVGEIDLNVSTSTLSGGKYLGRRGTPASSTSRTNRTPEIGRAHDPFKRIGNITLAPTVKLHGGVFGPKSDEIAGTIKLTATVPHQVTNANHLADARDGTITVVTSFAARNTSGGS